MGVCVCAYVRVRLRVCAFLCECACAAWEQAGVRQGAALPLRAMCCAQVCTGVHAAQSPSCLGLIRRFSGCATLPLYG